MAIAFALGAGAAASSAATALSSHPVVLAVRRGDCVAAVKLVNPEVTSSDAMTAFLAGRMLDEGICVQKDSIAATHFFARAADLGDKDAALDYAAKVGLGEGTEQSYERAGELCRAAGIDPQSRMSAYSLGYACTLRSVAGELLRASLPRGAFRPSSGPALVEFTPANSQMLVRATPQVGSAEAHTGSNVHGPLINARQEIDKAWRSAAATAPPPDAAQLDHQAIELALDVDMTLEIGREVSVDADSLRSLHQGEVRPAAQR